MSERLFMKRRFLTWTKKVPAVLLIPYVITFLANGAEAAVGSRMPDGEVLLPVLTARQIPTEYEKEAIQAQTVIARTNIYCRITQENDFWEMLHEVKKPSANEFWEMVLSKGVYEKAVNATKGQVLTWEGELRRIPFHELSSGMTRDGEEVLHDEAFAYLKSVDSSADKQSADYLNSTYVSARHLPVSLEIEQRDSAGYIQELVADGNPVEGEAFRQGMGLSSADFTVQKIGEKYRFLCKGIGHGLGFSQYGGNKMAENGSSWEEILEWYFPEMDLADIQRIFTEK